MINSIQANVSVAPGDIHLLDAALAQAQTLLGGARFVVTRMAPGQVALRLLADDHDQLVTALEAIGPLFATLDKRVKVDALQFGPGVKASVQARVAQAAA